MFLDAFWIDQTEVTNGMYAKCVDAGICAPPSSSKSFTRDIYYGNPEYNDYPVIYVSWDDAKTYCEWAGRRLPTEAEWEKAAGWDDDAGVQRLYPWGDSINETYANYKAEVGDTTAVGRYEKGASFYGAYDMTGNLWEWVADGYDSDYYSSSPGSNPIGPPFGEYRVWRGGSFMDSADRVRSTYCASSPPLFTDIIIGFRCSRSEASP